MNMNNIKNKWPMHVFFISQGISFVRRVMRLTVVDFTLLAYL